MRCRLASVLAALVLLSSIPASAQTLTAAHPAPTLNILYAHNAAAGADHYMNTLVEEEGAANPGYSNVANSAVTWSMTLRPTLTQTLLLDPAANVVFKVFMGGSQSVGRFSVTTTLSVGAAVVAAGAAKDHVITPSGASPAPVNPYASLTWETLPAIDRIEPGTDLVWTVTATGTGNAVFLGMTASRGNSFVQLPIMAVGAGQPEVEFEDLGLGDVDLDVEFASPANEVYVYNWTNEESALVVHYGATVVAGAATLVLRDPSGAAILDQKYTSSSNGSLDLVDPVAGKWTIEIRLDAFQGSLNVHIAPPGPDVDPPVPGNDDEGLPDPEPGLGSDDANETSNTTRADDKGSPMLAPLATLLVVGLAAIGRRRRD